MPSFVNAIVCGCYYLIRREVLVNIGGESAKTTVAVMAAGRQNSSVQIESKLLYSRKHHGALGLVLHMFLTVVGDAFFALKSLIKALGRVEVPASWWHIVTVFCLLLITHWSTQSTR